MSLRRLVEPGEMRHLFAVADWLKRPRQLYVIDEIRRRHGATRGGVDRLNSTKSLDVLMGKGTEDLPPAAIMTDDDVVPQAVMRAEDVERVRAALTRLPDRAREAMRLRLDGHPIKAVAAKMRCGVDNIDQLLRYARARLAGYLGG